MPVAPIPQEVLDQQQHEALVEATLAYPPPGNVAAATTYHDQGEIRYRDRRYRTRPTDWRTGARLSLLRTEYRQLMLSPVTAETKTQVLLVLQAIVDLLATLVIRPWWRRWRRVRPGRGVFQDAESHELETLLDFFSQARTRSPVSVRASVEAPGWLLPTIGMPGSFSPVGIHATWRRTVTPVAGVTTLTA